jgi:hypothetical protein
MSEQEYESDGTPTEEYEEADDDGGEWTGPDQESWQSIQQFQEQATPVLNQLGEFLNNPQVYGPQQLQQYGEQYGYGQPMEEQEELDPFDQENVSRFIARHVEQGINEALGPFQGILGTVASREGESRAKGELERIGTEVGEFDKDNAFLVASGMIEQGADPSEALSKAAMYSRQFEEKIRADEREKYKAELERLAGAPRETAIGSSSATENVGVPTGPDRYRIAVERALPGINGGNRFPVG